MTITVLENGVLRDATSEDTPEMAVARSARAAERVAEAQTQYQRDRAAEYPPIGDQLDALFKAGVFPADMAATLQAVKDKYPKG